MKVLGGGGTCMKSVEPAILLKLIHLYFKEFCFVFLYLASTHSRLYGGYFSKSHGNYLQEKQYVVTCADSLGSCVLFMY